MADNARIKLESQGLVLEAGSGFKDYKAYKIEGTSGLEYDFSYARNPYSPNAIMTNIAPMPREITLNIYCHGDKREFLNRFFNPMKPGKLTMTWGSQKRWIEYYPHPVKIAQNTVHQGMKCAVTLLCPSPFWKDMSDYGKNIAGKINLLGFPFKLTSSGIVSDYRMFSTTVSIFNSGDVPVGAVVVFKAAGTVVNPCLTLNGNEFLRAKITMSKGDTLEFSTNIDDLHVIFNGGDILNKTDPLMTFFQIPIGENSIEYSSDEGTANLQVLVYFTPLYVGL